MNSLIMLKMALMQLKEYSTNKWVIIDNKKYNIDTALSLIKVAEEDFTNFKGKMSDSNFKLYDVIEPMGEPIDSKVKLYDELGVCSSGYYASYPNHLPRLLSENVADPSKLGQSEDNEKK
jgi:hypothetical protein|tara:strand:+ start:1306 stop:1665 length:360 start_codon:yes stop_codon:yes gene_type:complete